VAISDADNSFGRSYKERAVSIGKVVHSDCVIAGHGPGGSHPFNFNNRQDKVSSR